MAPRYTFEQAIQVLEIDATAGPRGAKRGYMLQLQRHGPEPSPEDHARFTAAYEALKDPAAWPDYKEPEVWDDDLMPSSRPSLPPGHQRSERERPKVPTRPGTGDSLPPAPRPQQPAPRPQRPAEAQAENPFLVEEASPPKEQETVPSDVSALLAQEDIAESLARLDSNFGTVIDKNAFVGHMAHARIDGTVTLLNDLCVAGHLLALGAATTALLDLMTSDQSRTYLSNREVAKLLVEVFSAAGRDPKANTVASSMQRAHDRWATAAEATGASMDLTTKQTLRITRSLASLPEEFPDVLTAAIARSAQRADAASARPEFSAWLQEYPEQADGLRRIMARSAPALLTPLLDLFPDKDQPKASGGVPRWAGRALGAAVVLSLVLSAVFSDGLFDSDASAEMQEARQAICEFSGPSHSACVWARIISKSSGDEDCDVITPAIPKFLDALGLLTSGGGGLSGAVDLGALNAMKLEADRLVVIAQKMCPGN